MTMLLWQLEAIISQLMKFLPCILYTGNWFSYTPCIAADMGLTLEVDCHLDVMVLIIVSA